VATRNKPDTQVIAPETWRLAVKAAEDGMPPPDPEDNGDEFDEVEESATERVARMMRSVDGDDRAKLIVYRIKGPNKYGWCCEYSIHDFETGGYGMLRTQWGPGEYQIRLYATKPGSNYYGVRAKENITLEVMANEPSPVAANAAPSGISSALESMAANQKALLEALTARPAPVDPMAQMMQMFSMMKLMREATGEVTQQKSSIHEIMSTIKELRAVSEEINPPPADDSLIGQLPKILDLVQTGMAQQRAPESVQFPTVGIPPTLYTENQTPQPQVTELAQPSQEADMTLQMKAYLAVLIAMAAKDSDTDSAAELVYEHAPDEIIDMLENPAWFEVLSTVEAKVKPHKAWFEKVAAKVLSFIIEDNKANADTSEAPK